MKKDKKKLAPKTMYRVEKFTPPECPKCRQKFNQEDKDWTTLLGYLEKGEKVMKSGYPIIICSKCNNRTLIIRLEAYQVFDLKFAKNLLKKGFVNLKKVEFFGSTAEDIHIKYV